MNKEPWTLSYTPWKSQSAFFSYIRGGLRRAVWKNHPVKLEYMKQTRVRVPLGKKTEKNPEGLVWGFKCECCGGLFKTVDCEVDHKTPSGQLKSEEDIKDFILRLSFVDFDDLQMVCKECHGVITLSQKLGCTLKEAKVEKKRVEFFKQKVSDQKESLLSWGASENELGNAVQRKKAFYKYFKEGEISE